LNQSPSHNCCCPCLWTEAGRRPKEKRHTLAQRDQAHRKDLATLASVYVVSRRRLELYGIEESLVIVHRAIIDVFDGLAV